MTERIRRRGWFVIPEQLGDRTLDEQMLGLKPALMECGGRTVLDIGCAEGLIGFEFAKAGAAHVHGIEVVQDHIQTAYRLREKLKLTKAVTFEVADLGELPAPTKQYDIVLALGVAHKLKEPAVGIRWAAKASRDLVVIRFSAGTVDTVLRSKRYSGKCDVNAEMKKAGFTVERTEAGPRDETVTYYRKC